MNGYLLHILLACILLIYSAYTANVTREFNAILIDCSCWQTPNDCSSFNKHGMMRMPLSKQTARQAATIQMNNSV